jgi:hypothetical protein
MNLPLRSVYFADADHYVEYHAIFCRAFTHPDVVMANFCRFSIEISKECK